jgi:ElaB/YqjD/DUF883 family membrane-anchored ribosome-binding protein
MEPTSERTITPVEPTSASTDKLLGELKLLLQRAEEAAVQRAKAADRVIRDHPYQTIGLAFGLGLLIGVLARRR